MELRFTRYIRKTRTRLYTCIRMCVVCMCVCVCVCTRVLFTYEWNEWNCVLKGPGAEGGGGCGEVFAAAAA